MHPNESIIHCSEDFIKKIANCIADAVGDGIIEDVRSHGLITQNSTPNRIWDFINTNIHKAFISDDIIANKTKRGPWEMYPIFDRSSGFVFTIMREERFTTLRKELPRRRSAHYIDAFSGSINANLIAPKGQMSFIPHLFSNSDHLKDIVTNILDDLSVPYEIVKCHAIILFSSYNNELKLLRCCVVDSNLNIVDEVDWCRYISVSERTMVETVSDITSDFSNPTKGLVFKQKAKDKIDQQQLPNNKERDNKEQNRLI